MLARARHLHIGSYFIQAPAWPELLALARTSRATGLTISVDPNWDPSGTWDGGLKAIASESDVLLPNAAEACHLAGLDGPERAALALARGAARPVVVVKLGAQGALAATPQGAVVRVPALPVEPVDTTGAGDSFDAGFLAAWLEGRDLAACPRVPPGRATL